MKKPKQRNIDTSMYEIYNEDTQQKEQLDKETIFMYGHTDLDYKKDGKYYHGCGPMETINLYIKKNFPEEYLNMLIIRNYHIKKLIHIMLLNFV